LQKGMINWATRPAPSPSPTRRRSRYSVPSGLGRDGLSRVADGLVGHLSEQSASALRNLYKLTNPNG
jgi:hypothetical protein